MRQLMKTKTVLAIGIVAAALLTGWKEATEYRERHPKEGKRDGDA